MIILTGVNRSGTSMTTQLLAELGMDIGPRSLLLGPDHRNPKGYFENKEILFMNIYLLLGDGVDPTLWEREIDGETLWPWERFWKLLAKSRYFTVSGRTIMNRASRKASEMTALAHKYENVLVNDARFSFTLSAWAKYARISKILYCYRHPTNVVRSMRKAYGLPVRWGYWYWCQRVDTFLQQAQGIPLVMINYNSMFSGDTCRKEVQRLYRFAGRRYQEGKASEILRRVVEPSLRNQRCALEPLPGRVSRLWESLSHYHRFHEEPRPFARATGEVARIHGRRSTGNVP